MGIPEIIATFVLLLATVTRAVFEAAVVDVVLAVFALDVDASGRPVAPIVGSVAFAVPVA
jgi:hypothetical protein